MRTKTSLDNKTSNERKIPTKVAKKQPKKHLQTPTKTKIWTLYRNHSQAEIVRILKDEDNITVTQPAISVTIDTDWCQCRYNNENTKTKEQEVLYHS